MMYDIKSPQNTGPLFIHGIRPMTNLYRWNTRRLTETCCATTLATMEVHLEIWLWRPHVHSTGILKDFSFFPIIYHAECFHCCISAS